MLTRVYVITHTPTGMKYVGTTAKLLFKHLRKYHSVAAFYKDRSQLMRLLFRRPLGEFTIEELASSENKAEANQLREYWVNKLKTTHPDGLNLHRGNLSGHVFPREAREKVKESFKQYLYRGKYYSLKDLHSVSYCPVSYPSLSYRMRTGWSVEDALKYPPRSQRPRPSHRSEPVAGEVRRGGSEC